jgi:hypothetical protein
MFIYKYLGEKIKNQKRFSGDIKPIIIFFISDVSFFPWMGEGWVYYIFQYIHISWESFTSNIQKIMMASRSPEFFLVFCCCDLM